MSDAETTTSRADGAVTPPPGSEAPDAAPETPAGAVPETAPEGTTDGAPEGPLESGETVHGRHGAS